MNYKFLLLLTVFLIFTSLNCVGQVKIFGGEDIDISEVPWQISLEVDGTHICGGSIIDEEWILTAAHCVVNVDESQLSIHAGSTDQTNNNVGQIISVDEKIIHPNYAPADGSVIPITPDQNDLALLKLSSPLVLNDNVQVITYANTENWSTCNNTVGSIARISGWGDYDSTNQSSDMLLAIEIPIIGVQEANDIYNNDLAQMLCPTVPGELIENPINPINMIPFYNTDQSTGGGDSGGPAVINFNTNPMLVGVTSWGGCPNIEFPSVFVDIFQLSSFIGNNINPSTIELSGTTYLSDLINNQTLPNGQLSQKKLKVDGNFIIDGSYEILNCEFEMTPGSLITLANGFIQIGGCKTTFFSENELWDGIRVLSSAFASFNNVQIENAFIGINAFDGELEIENTSFLNCSLGAQFVDKANVFKFQNNELIVNDQILDHWQFGNLNTNGIGMECTNMTNSVIVLENYFAGLGDATIVTSSHVNFDLNSVEDCDQGFQINFGETDITNNIFKNTFRSSIKLWYCFKNNLIEGNTFTNDITDLDLAELRMVGSGDSEIINNEFTFSSSMVSKRSIRILNSNLNFISDNTISYISINASDPTTISSAQVQLSNCYKNTISCNLISSLPFGENAILAEISPNSIASCNAISSQQVAIAFEGECDQSTVFTNDLFSNEFGLHINPGVSRIGIQNHHGNLFQNGSISDNAKARNVAEDNQIDLSQFRVDLVDIYNPSVVDPTDWFQNFNVLEPDCDPGITCIDGNIGSGFTNNDPEFFSTDCIVRFGNGTIWNSLTDCQKWIRIYQQYELARRIADPSLLNDCQIELLNFFAINGYNQVYDFEQLLWEVLEGDSAYTLSDVENAIPNVTGINYLDNISNVLINMIATFNGNEIQNVNSMIVIASMGIQEGGKATILSRSLLDNFNISYNTNGTNNCGNIVIPRNSDDGIVSRIFPNPISINQSVNLDLDADNEVNIYNYLGNVVYTGNLNKGVSQLSLDLEQGVYIILIQNLESKTSEVQKLIVIE